MNSEITLDSDGSLTLTPEMLAHLRVRPGQKLKVSLTEEGQVILSAPFAPGAQLLRGMLGRKAGE
jgi:formylmethanofuran dehydrogenase subunit D